MNIAMRPWGDAPGGPAHLFEIEGEGLRARVSDFGGIIQALEAETAPGLWRDIALGYDTLEEYLNSETCFGAAVGPLADRTAGGLLTLDGAAVALPRNAGPDSMHCGDRGFHRALWQAEPLPDGLRLSRVFSDDPLPGALSVAISYRVAAPRTLRLEYAARCSRETAVSFTNHSYFNLTGARTDCRDHRLTLRAARYAETERDAEPICTGRALPVAGTPLDLRTGPRLGDVLDRTDFREIAAAGGLDHYFPVDGAGFREQARLCCPGAGLMLICRSDAPGLLAYAGNGLAHEGGKGGIVYGKNWGVCLETERFPNAVNRPADRASVVLRPGETFRSVTEFELRVD